MARQHRTHRRLDLMEMLDFIKEYSAKHGQSPSLNELCFVMGDRSTSTIRHGLARLEKQGKIKRRPGTHRSIVILEEGAGEG